MNFFERKWRDKIKKQTRLKIGCKVKNRGKFRVALIRSRLINSFCRRFTVFEIFAAGKENNRTCF